MKNPISVMLSAGLPQTTKFLPATMGGGQTFLRILAMCILFQIATLPGWAQCPITTYNVGSGVGIPNLSGAPAGVANLTAGQTIMVTGTFTVDAGSWLINGATVYLTTAASEIIVNAGRTLNAAAGTTFRGCNPTDDWYGIRVQSGGTILADHCTFNNGLYAINTFANTTFRVTNNIFNTCTRGIKIWGQQNPLNHTVSGNIFNSNSSSAIYITGRDVTVGYNTYQRTGTAFGTGITLNNSQNILIAGGQMTNLARGLDILPVPASSCIEMKDVIFSGERGVTSDGARYALNIHNCLIRATKTAINIKNHLTATLPNPGIACNGNIRIADNTINSYSETGVRITSALGDGTVTVYHNFIGTEIASTGFGHYGVEIVSVLKAIVVVDFNRIVNSKEVIAGTPPGAIYLNNCKFENTISRNTVIASPGGGFGDMVFGIKAVGTPHLRVSDNSIDGGPNVMDRAISIENAMMDVDLCCNIMTKSTKGLYFLGPVEDCIIQTSIYGQHVEGLYYDMVVSSSAAQFHNGNDWSGAGTTWDGYFNGNPFSAAALRYRVNPTLIPNGLNKIFVTGGNPSDWFSTPTGTELTCNSACGNGFSGNSENELTGNDHWAMATLADVSYSTLHWGAQRNLFAKLLANPALLENTQASTFFNAAQNGNIGKFHTIEAGIANLYDPTITADPAQKLADLAALNSSISTQADYQAYEKSINQIYLAALTQNNWDFSASEKVAIDDIAARCPQLAGDAVYTARFLQENYRVPAWNTDCAFVGARSGNAIIQERDISAYPNPAQTEVVIALSQPALSECKIMVFNMMGRIVSTASIPTGSTDIVLPVSNYPNGNYIISVSETGRQPWKQKLSILH